MAAGTVMDPDRWCILRSSTGFLRNVCFCKNKGRSIGSIIETYIGKTGKKLFLLFCWLFCILVVAAFADVVAGTFNGFLTADDGTVSKITANGAVATTSMLFIIEAVCLGMILRYGKLHKWVNTAIAIVMLVGAVALGMNFPMYLPRTTWHVIIFIYILIASVSSCMESAAAS